MIFIQSNISCNTIYTTYCIKHQCLVSIFIMNRHTAFVILLLCNAHLSHYHIHSYIKRYIITFNIKKDLFSFKYDIITIHKTFKVSNI